MTARALGGVFAPVTTPFEPRTGELALPQAVQNVQRLLANGLDGIVVGGTTGEASLLEPEEFRRLVARLRPAVPSERWLVAGTGAESTRAAIALTRAAAAEGVDAVLVRAPSYYSAAHTAESLGAHYRAVADASPVPVLVYNIPKHTHLPVPPELLGRLATHGNIVGVKDSSGDLANLRAYRAAVPGWAVFVGSGSLLAPALEAGCVGGIVGVACFAAAVSAELYATFRAGHLGRVETLQKRLGALDKEIVARGPAAIKAAMDAVGLYGGPVRDPIAPLGAQERERIGQLLAA